MSTVPQPQEPAPDTRWLACKIHLQEQLGDALQRWFAEMRATVEGEGETAKLQLVFPTFFIRGWVEEHFGEQVRQAWRYDVPQGPVVFGVDPTLRRHPEEASHPTAQVIPCPQCPEEARPVTNDLARSALFSCVQGKDRQMLEKALIATIDGVEIHFTGRQLNQDDHDVLMQLVFMARHKPLGDAVMIPAHAILKSMGRGTSGKEHRQLHDAIERLVAGTVKVRNTKRRMEYIGHLVDKAVQDETKRHWVYVLNPDLRTFYSPDAYTLIDWETRQRLSGKDLARWLQLYLATHAAPFPVKVDTLRKLSGSRMKTLRDFRRQLRLALASLQANGDITAWAIDANDRITVERIPSPTQARHLIDKLTGKERHKSRKKWTRE